MSAKKGFVYFLQIKGKDLFKIGYTKNEPQGKLKQLARGAPGMVELVGVIRSIHRKAARDNVHRIFKQHHTHGGWYHVSRDEVLAFLRETEECIDVALDSDDFAVEDGRYLVLRCFADKGGWTVTTERCPFCGSRHSHGIGGRDALRRARAIGECSLGHRCAHCTEMRIEVELPGGTRVNSGDGYCLNLCLN